MAAYNSVQKHTKRKHRLEVFLHQHGGWLAEYQFHPERKWRFDYAQPAIKLAIEIEGGGYVRGRHSGGKGFANDLAKYFCAQMMGWQVIRINYAMITDENLTAIACFMLGQNPPKT